MYPITPSLVAFIPMLAGLFGECLFIPCGLLLHSPLVTALFLLKKGIPFLNDQPHHTASTGIVWQCPSLFALVGLYSGYYPCLGSPSHCMIHSFLLRRYGWLSQRPPSFSPAPPRHLSDVVDTWVALTSHPCWGLGDTAAAFIFALTGTLACPAFPSSSDFLHSSKKCM